MPETPDTSIPAFTRETEGAPAEDPMDEADILGDQDQTKTLQPGTDDENMGAQSYSLDSLENEPADFMRGDLDVKEQMDRAADALEASLAGWESQAYEDDPRGDLGASFRATPGGLEEVEMKTDQDLATHRHPHPRPNDKKDKEVQP